MPGSTNRFKNESYFLAQIHVKGYQSGTETSEIKFSQFVFNYVIIVVMKITIFINVETLTWCPRPPCW